MFSKLKQMIKHKQKDSSHRTREETPESELTSGAKTTDRPSPPTDPSKLTISDSKPHGKSFQVSKKGIRKIASDAEMYDYFYSQEEKNAPPSANEVMPQPKRSSLQKTSPKRQKTNKHGVRIIDSGEDLYEEMISASSDAEVSDRRNQPVKSVSSDPGLVRKDKHGIPVLNSTEDFKNVFSEDESFADVLEQSLGGKTTEVLLREKRDHMVTRKPMTLKQKLKRYPLPQGQLDLHGYTSLKADLKADAYLRHAFANEVYTVRLIVGKGLHSEEGPVLPDVIENRLVVLRKEKIVLAYEWDHRVKAKSGSVTVYLNNAFNR